MTARPLAPEADLAHVLQIARDALAAGVTIDPETLLCDLLRLEPSQLPGWLDPEPLKPGRTYRNGDTFTIDPQPADRSKPASRAREAEWRQAEAGTMVHLLEHGRPLCGSQDAGPWRTVAGAPRCAACVELSEVLARHG